jgi:hypothetical protein
VQPTYDTVYCTLEPDPNFYGGGLSSSNNDCEHDFGYYDAATKIWNCPWDVNSKLNWLTTDGFKIVVDTSLATASTTIYSVSTYYYLWCACTDSTYLYYDW